MASSPMYRATPELPRPRSSYSVPAHSRDSDRGTTPSSRRGLHSFYNRSVTPSARLIQESNTHNDPIIRVNRTKLLASRSRLLRSWSEVTEKYKNIGLEDDEEIDLEQETVHRSDGSVGRWRPDRHARGEGSGSEDESEEDEDSDNESIQAGPSRRLTTNPEDADDESDEEDEDEDNASDSDQSEEEEDDDIESWTVQEEDFRVALADKKAALLLTSLKAGPEQTSDEEMAEFLREEEAQRVRRMSARVEGRDSRCHTDKLSGSDSDAKPPLMDYRSPSNFSTIIASTRDDLFSSEESGEDEMAIGSSAGIMKAHMRESWEEPDEEEMERTEADISLEAIDRARQLRQPSMAFGSESGRRLTIELSPDSTPESSPERDIFSERTTAAKTLISAARGFSSRNFNTAPSRSGTAARSSARPSRLRETATKSPVVEPAAHVEDAPSPSREVQANDVVTQRRDKGKGRMIGERPVETTVLTDVFGPTDTVDPDTLDRRRYRRSRYRQKNSTNYKRCRYCRDAGPNRARLAEYCRGANHSKHCTFEFPQEYDDSATNALPVKLPVASPNKYWKDNSTQVITPLVPVDSSTTTPGNVKKRGLTFKGLERWRYYENLVKKPDKQTDRSCPYCRQSTDSTREENAVYCRGRIESKDCTFDGHKGSLRLSSKTKKSRTSESQPPPPKPQVVTPKAPAHDADGPDLTVDEKQLDHKLYYASLIRDQTQTGYRFCSDCARSLDPGRQRLSFWCRGRISYKSCGHWDGDDAGHRRAPRLSGSGVAPATSNPGEVSAKGNATATTTSKKANKATPTSTTKASGDNTKHARSSDPVLSLYHSEIQKLKRGAIMHCMACSSAGGVRERMSAYCKGRTSAGWCLFSEVDSKLEERVGADTEKVPRKRGRPRKSNENATAPLTPLVAAPPTLFPVTDSVVERPRTEPIKRKRGRPRKTLPDMTDTEPSITDPDRHNVRRRQSLPAIVKETPGAVSSEVKRKRGGPRKSAPEVSATMIEDEPVKSKVGRPSIHPPKPVIIAETILEQHSPSSLPTKVPTVRPGLRPDGGGESPFLATTSRKRRARTFDIVVPVSHTASHSNSSPTLDRPSVHARASNQFITPVTSMRNNRVFQQDSSLRHTSDDEQSEILALPPSSPPPSLSPEKSPQSARLGHSIHRSSMAPSDTESASRPIKGILRQSSEFSDAPRSNKRARFSLMRSPTPEDESDDMAVDSDSSDDELLLVDPSSSLRRTNPPSSRRNGSSSPFAPEPRFGASPSSGRLSSSMLAAYAPTLDQVPSYRLGSAAPPHRTPPQPFRLPIGQRSSLSSPPITFESIDDQSRRGMMLPPPVPSGKSFTPTPQTEPRPTGATKRAHTAGPAQRPRAQSLHANSSPLPSRKFVAENKVFRRLIGDIH